MDTPHFVVTNKFWFFFLLDLVNAELVKYLDSHYQKTAGQDGSLGQVPLVNKGLKTIATTTRVIITPMAITKTRIVLEVVIIGIKRTT
jgi:hypothetical protein